MDNQDISTLIGDPKNPRKISTAQFEKLKTTLAKFGDLSGIIKNLTTGELVGGHMRVKAFQADPSAQASIQITQRYDQPTEAGTLAIGNIVIKGEPYGYREVQWTRPMQRAANIAANHAGGEDDIDLLAEVVYELSQDENAAELLALTSIDDDDLSKLLDMSGASGESDPADDEAPEVDTANPPVSKLGEIYQLGNHRLMCGDSTDFGAVSDLMNGQKADMIFTDPPYGMNLDTDYAKRPLSEASAEKHSNQNSYAPVIGDDRPYDPAHIFEMFSDTKEMFLWGGDYYAQRLPETGSWFVWDKRKGMEDLKYTNAAFELCWSKKPHAREIVRVAWFGLIGTEQQDIRTRVHPTQKPLEVCDYFIKEFSERGNIIVDLFGGSGSTLIACEQTGRTCYMMELDPHYIDVIRKRYAKHIGQEENWQAATPCINEAQVAQSAEQNAEEEFKTA